MVQGKFSCAVFLFFFLNGRYYGKRSLVKRENCRRKKEVSRSDSPKPPREESPDYLGQKLRN